MFNYFVYGALRSHQRKALPQEAARQPRQTRPHRQRAGMTRTLPTLGTLIRVGWLAVKARRNACSVFRGSSRSRLWDLSCPLAPPSDGGQRAIVDHNRGAREPGWCVSSAASCDDRLRHGSARSGEADVQGEVPEPELEYAAAGPVHDESQHDDGQDDDDQPEEEHDNAGDGMPGYRSRSSHGRPARAAGSGGTRARSPQRQRGWCGGQPGTASTVATTTRSRKRCMAGSFFLPDPLDPAPRATGAEEP